MSTLFIAVPHGRAFCGRAILVASDRSTRAGPFRVLATASVRVAREHGNPDASPLRPFGHPPEGSYLVAATLPPGYVHAKRRRRYGRVGGLLLAPRSGDALVAAGAGRKLVALHGGPRDEKRRLRPTRGGIRLSSRDLLALLSAVNDAQRDGDPLATIELVEVEMSLSRNRDKKGNHSLRVPRRKRDMTIPPVPMILLPLAFGAAKKGNVTPVARRDVLALVALAFGELAFEACDNPGRELAQPEPAEASTWECYPADASLDDAGAYIGPDGGNLAPTLFDAGCPPGYVGWNEGVG